MKHVSSPNSRLEFHHANYSSSATLKRRSHVKSLCLRRVCVRVGGLQASTPVEAPAELSRTTLVWFKVKGYAAYVPWPLRMCRSGVIDPHFTQTTFKAMSRVPHWQILALCATHISIHPPSLVCRPSVWRSTAVCYERQMGSSAGFRNERFAWREYVYVWCVGEDRNESAVWGQSQLRKVGDIQPQLLTVEMGESHKSCQEHVLGCIISHWNKTQIIFCLKKFVL